MNLRNKEYYVFNKKYSKEAYKKFKSNLNFGSFSKMNILQEKWKTYLLGFSRKFAEQKNSENCVGDVLYNCKNVFFGSVIFNGENCKYYDGGADTVKNSYDILIGGEHEWAYESMTPDHTYMVIGTQYCGKS